MIYAIVGGVICAFALGALISGTISYRDGYDQAIRDVYEQRQRKRI